MQNLSNLTKEQLQQFSKDELIDLILLLIKQNEELKGQVAALKNEVEELKHKLNLRNKDSNNSSKPPSSDNKPNGGLHRSFKSGKKPGGQKGHAGSSREHVENPDEIIKCSPSTCTSCGNSLDGIDGILKAIRQLIDIPPIKPHVAEYQLLEITCPCGCKNVGSFPEGIKAPVQFGDNLKSLIIYLNIFHHLPYDRLTQILTDLLGIDISEGTIDNILDTAKSRAEPYYDKIRELILKSKWIGSDETGIRVNDENWFLWVWQNLLFSYFVSHKSRAYEVVKEYFGECFKGTLVSDCFGSQNKTEAGDHQHCHLHYLRPLDFCKDYEKESYIWALEVSVFLMQSWEARRVIWEDGYSKENRERIIDSFELRLNELTKVPLTTKEAIKIQNRLKKHRDKILTFMRDPDIPYHNNGSERAIRKAKIHRKVSGCFRSENGAKRFAQILSVIETARKHGFKVMDAIQKMLTGNLVFQATS
jgi:transposase